MFLLNLEGCYGVMFIGNTKGLRGGRASGWQLAKGSGENIICNFAILKMPQN